MFHSTQVVRSTLGSLTYKKINCGERDQEVSSRERGQLKDDSASCVQDDASLKCWGNNRKGKLGLGDSEHRGDGPNGKPTPTP